VLALSPDDALTFEAERRRRLVGMAAAPAQIGFAAELVLAADTFVITPVGRIADGARARAEGDEVRTVIAGYHWFTDWGRDTMISLEGLTLATGRAIEARWILRTFAHYVRDGLIPNLFPEGQNQGLYHTADATLWFFHALHRYVEHSRDKATLELLLPILKDIARSHLEGTRFGIKVDPHDGLLTQGAEGYALTWMDAKVGDWVVTPRRGKAIEINALWYNALRLLVDWLREAQDLEADEFAAHADQTRASFNRRFWHAAGGYLYDVVDGENGDDAAFRPNQIFALALEHPVLDREYWEAVVTAVHAKLVTPVGLRSLAPGEPDYKPRYFGDLRARDAAYHQGTVWAWLMGPFIDAWLRVYPDDRAAARHFLDGFEPHIAEAGIGSISEVFDAEPPFTPRGCVAQAWSVAEVLRCLEKTAVEKGLSAPSPSPVCSGAGAPLGDLPQGGGRDVAGQDDSRDLVTERLPQAGDDLQAIQTLRQVVVGDDKVQAHRPSRRQLQRLSPILDGRREMTLAVEQECQHLAHRRIVLDDQDCAADVRFPLPRATRGEAAIAARLDRAAPLRRRPSPCPDWTGHRRCGPAGLPSARRWRDRGRDLCCARVPDCRADGTPRKIA
jgi:hypothetical protein